MVSMRDIKMGETLLRESRAHYEEKLERCREMMAPPPLKRKDAKFRSARSKKAAASKAKKRKARSSQGAAHD